MSAPPKPRTLKQLKAVAAREAFAVAEATYKAATIAAYPIGTTVFFNYGRHWLEGVVNGYTYLPGTFTVLNPRSGKTLKVCGCPWTVAYTPEVLEELPRCQKCGEPGTALAASEDHEYGACFCAAHMPKPSRPTEDSPDP